MNETEILKKLTEMSDQKDIWEENIPYVSALLSSDSVKIQAKALWLLGEMGLEHPSEIADSIALIASFLESPLSMLRQRALNALGRCDRGSFELIEPYFQSLFRFGEDEDPGVRHAFIWAMENIGAETPDCCINRMDVFAKMLYDDNDKVRMEAPEIFRVIGRRRPAAVIPYIDTLHKIAETDQNRVVRIHCLGAIRALKYIPN